MAHTLGFIILMLATLIFAKEINGSKRKVVVQIVKKEEKKEQEVQAQA